MFGSEQKFIHYATRVFACIVAFGYCVSIVYLHRAFVLDFRHYSWQYSTIDGAVLSSLDTFVDPILSTLRPSTRALMMKQEAWLSSSIALILVDSVLLAYAVYSIVIGKTLLFSRILLGVTYAVALSTTTYFPAPSDAMLPYTSHLRTMMLIDPVTLVRMLIFMDARVRFSANLFLVVYGMMLLCVYSLVARVCYTSSIVLAIALAFTTHNTALDVVVIACDAGTSVKDLLGFAVSSCRKTCWRGKEETNEENSEQQYLQREHRGGERSLDLPEALDDPNRECVDTVTHQ